MLNNKKVWENINYLSIVIPTLSYVLTSDDAVNWYYFNYKNTQGQNINFDGDCYAFGNRDPIKNIVSTKRHTIRVLQQNKTILDVQLSNPLYPNNILEWAGVVYVNRLYSNKKDNGLFYIFGFDGVTGETFIASSALGFEAQTGDSTLQYGWDIQKISDQFIKFGFVYPANTLNNLQSTIPCTFNNQNQFYKLTSSTRGMLGVFPTEINNLLSINSIIFDPLLPNYIIAGAAGYNATSIDATTWIPHNLTNSDWMHLSYSQKNHTVVMVGTNGYIAKSTDYGITWTLNRIGTNNWLRVIYHPTLEMFIVVGGQYISKSTDFGETWTPPEQLISTPLCYLDNISINDVNPN
jgi:hypothetical protein